MGKIKVEDWNGHQIRFVMYCGEWWAVLKDITDALKLKTWKVNQRLVKDLLSKYTLDTTGGPQEMSIVNEIGIYDAVFTSRKKEAREFQLWVYNMLRELRKATGLEGFEIFRMMDKEHQKEAMAKLKVGLVQAAKVDYIKANTIANKAISTMHGFPKMIKKEKMTPDMLVSRQQILDDTVMLMEAVDRFSLDIPVAKTVYDKHLQYN